MPASPQQSFPPSKPWSRTTSTNTTAAVPSPSSSSSPFIVGVDSDSLFLSPPNSSLPWSSWTADIAATAAASKRHTAPRRLSSGLFPAGWQQQQHHHHHHSSLYSPAVADFGPDFYHPSSSSQALTRSLTEAAGQRPYQELQSTTAGKPKRIPLKRRHSSQYEDIRAAAGSRSSFSSVSSAASSCTAASQQQRPTTSPSTSFNSRQHPVARADFEDSAADDLLFAEPGPVDFDDFDIFPGTSSSTATAEQRLIASPDRMDATLSRPPSPSTVNKELGVIGDSSIVADTSSSLTNTGLAVPQISTAAGSELFLDNNQAANNIKQEPSAHAQGLSDSACAYDLRDHQEPPTVKKEYPPDDKQLHKSQLEKITNGEDPLKKQLDIEPGPVCFPPTTPIVSEPTEPSEFAPAVGLSQAKGVGDYAKSPLLSSSVPPSLAVEEEQRYRDGKSASTAPDLPLAASLLPPLPQPLQGGQNLPSINSLEPTSYFEQPLAKGDNPNISRPANRAGQPSFLKNTGDGIIRTPGPMQMVSPKEAFKDYTNVTGIREEPKAATTNGGTAPYNALMQALGHSQKLPLTQMQNQQPTSPQSNRGDLKPTRALPPMPPQPQLSAALPQSTLPPPPSYAMFAGYQPAPQQVAPALPSTLNYQSAPAPLAFHDGGFFSNQAILASLAAEQNAKGAAAAAATAPSIASNPFAQHFPPQQQQQQYQAQQHAAAQAAAQLPLPGLNSFPFGTSTATSSYGNMPLATSDLVSQHFGQPGGNGPLDVSVTSTRKRGRPKGSLNGGLRRTSSGGKGSRSNIRTTNAGTDDTSEDDYGAGHAVNGQLSSGRPLRDSRAKPGDKAQLQDNQSNLLSSSYYTDTNQSLAGNNSVFTGYGYNGHASSDAAAAAAAAAALAGERPLDEGLGSIQDEDSPSEEDGDEWIADDSDDSFGKPVKKKQKRTLPNSANNSIPSSMSTASGISLPPPVHAKTARSGPAGSVSGLDAEGNPISEGSPGSVGTGRSRQQAPPGTGNILCDFVDPKTGTRCPVKFRRPYDQARHMETVHNAATEKVKWACSTCKKQFSRKDALIRHGRISAHPT